ncbi:hypothetical protein ACIQ9P_24340 [Kitasatospora sp. NPDC094019]|uniref:hypothetical protein n=1 Tax=Kitasatospora sp. NPDC094019 TaxID=3364091 RepID=UPI00380853F4
MIVGSASPPNRSPRRHLDRSLRRTLSLLVPLALLLVPAGAAAAGAPRTPTVRPAGGEARAAVRLEVRTNGATGGEVRVRADEPLLRVYRLTNRAEYRLTVTSLKDPQVSGAPVVCGGEQPLVLAPLGVVECSATLPAHGGPQRTEVRVEAAAPKGMPQAVATAQAGYRGLVAGMALARVGTPTGSGVVARADRGSDRGADRSTDRGVEVGVEVSAAADASLSVVRRSGRRALPMAAGGDLRLRYRVDAVGDSPISAVSVAEHLPGAGPVSCTGQSAAGLLEPGKPLDCAAEGSAVPGRHTGVARVEGLAVDGAVGQDGRPLPPRPVAAEAAGDYEGQSPASVPSGSGPDSVPPGAGPGQGTAAGSTDGGRPPAPGSANPAGAPPAAAPGVAANALPPNPAAPNAAAPPAGSAAAPNAAPNAGANAGANAAAAAGQAAAPGTAGAAAAAAAGSAVPYRPGTSAFGLPASPFQAVPAAGAAGAAGAANAAGAAGSAGTAVGGAGAGAGASGGSGPGPGASSAGPGQSGDSAAPTPRGNAASAARSPDDGPFDWDEDWDAGEVMLLLLAIMLPVLVVLSAALSVRQRARSGPGGGGGD